MTRDHQGSIGVDDYSYSEKQGWRIRWVDFGYGPSYYGCQHALLIRGGSRHLSPPFVQSLRCRPWMWDMVMPLMSSEDGHPTPEGP